MPLKFNPLTGKLDLVGEPQQQTVQTPNYVQTFDSGPAWGFPSGGYYTIEVPAAIHLKGLDPVVQVYELSGSDYQEVTVAISVDSNNGKVSIGVLSSPDERFEGKLIIAENN